VKEGAGGRWSYPWLVFGTNAIAAYVLSEVLAVFIYAVHISFSGKHITLKGFIFEHVFAHIRPPGTDSLVFATTFVAVCFVPSGSFTGSASLSRFSRRCQFTPSFFRTTGFFPVILDSH
jgi:predicted acyltransferase